MDKQNKVENKPNTSAPETDHATPKGSWEHIDSDLKSALNTWSELTDTMANKIPPDEERLRDIKNLLGTLKDQLKEFSDDSVPPDTQEKP